MFKPSKTNSARPMGYQAGGHETNASSTVKGGSTKRSSMPKTSRMTGTVKSGRY